MLIPDIFESGVTFAVIVFKSFIRKLLCFIEYFVYSLYINNKQVVENEKIKIV